MLRSPRLLAAFALITVGLLGSLSLLAPRAAAAFGGCRAETAPAINQAYEAKVVELVNQERAKHNLPPLKLNSSLTAAARYHATDMGQDDYFNHNSLDAGGKVACGTFDRISLWYTGWNAAAENIAAGYNTPEQVMEGWMNSPGHRDNILSAKYTELGVGYFTGQGTFPNYWVQDFGVRGDVTPMILAGDAATTTTRDLDVYVHGSWQEIRLRNDNGEWSKWMPFNNSFTWTINDGRGDHYVAAELRGGGAIRTSCDKITLDVPAVAGAPVNAAHKLYMPAVQTDPPRNCE